MRTISVCAILALSVACLVGQEPKAPQDSKAKIPEEKSLLPGWEMSWVEGNPFVILVAQEGKKPLEVCVGRAIAKKKGNADRSVVLCGAIKDGKIPTAREVASDESLSGKVKILTLASYEKWKQQQDEK